MEDQGLLSPAEGRVLQQLVLGYTNEQIAGKLFISITTVKKHVAHISYKMHASGSRTYIVGESYRRGWLPLNPGIVPPQAEEVAVRSARGPPVGTRGPPPARRPNPPPAFPSTVVMETRRQLKDAGLTGERSEAEWHRMWKEHPEMYDDFYRVICGTGVKTIDRERRLRRAYDLEHA
jgi:DNA-binding CsgD family transcriptional regulator